MLVTRQPFFSLSLSALALASKRALPEMQPTGPSSAKDRRALRAETTLDAELVCMRRATFADSCARHERRNVAQAKLALTWSSRRERAGVA
jgi:hypothetical protein